MADLKNTNINDNLELPSGTTSERPSSPQEGQIRYNTDLETVEFYNGENWRPLSDTHPEATGGTVVDTDIGGVPYRIHYFSETGTDTLTVTNPGEVEYLIVAGGGFGGSGVSSSAGGGGGAGGVLQGNTTLSAGSVSVSVGTGGVKGAAGEQVSAEDSSLGSITAIAGGDGGNGDNPNRVGGNGGSGGGGGSRRAGGTASSGVSGGSGTTGQGNNGGRGVTGNDPNTGLRSGGGGGGAGQAGEGWPDATMTDGFKGGDGGHGITINITGQTQFYAGGGGGATRASSGVKGLGGNGGGGDGGTSSDGQDADPNTGGGGGGGGNTERLGGSGGSGIVIVRYLRNSSLDTEPDETRPSFQPYNYARDVRPIVSRTGLVVDLDAANPLSYSGSGTTWTDMSGNENNANLIESKFISSQYGYFLFDRPDDRIQAIDIPHSAEMNNGNLLTAEFWFNSPVTGWSTGASNNIFASKGSPACFYGNTCSGWNIGLKGDNRFFVALDTDYYNNPVPVFLNTGEFTHMVFTFDNESLKIYKNGILEYTDNTGPKNIDSTDKIAISDIDFGGPRTLNGFLSTVRIYNRPLSINEIQQNFDATRSRYGI